MYFSMSHFIFTEKTVWYKSMGVFWGSSLKYNRPFANDLMISTIMMNMAEDRRARSSNLSSPPPTALCE
jgi:hypothetical protein